MSILKEFAIKALKEGSDYFGETITGEVGKLTYSEKQDYYSMTVFLLEENNHKSTSGVGFYLSVDKTSLEVCSGHMMKWKIPLCPDIVYEMITAEIDTL